MRKNMRFLTSPSKHRGTLTARKAIRRIFNQLPAIAPLIILFTTSCSIFASSTSTSVKIPAKRVSSNSWRFTQLSAEPFVYRADNSSDGHALYFTAIKDCGLPKNSVNTAALTRQLLVGFENIRVLRKDNRSLNDTNITQVFFSASLDNTPLVLVSYSFQKADCITDVVFWDKKSASQSFITENTDQLDKLFLIALKEIG
ncbi:MAG: hypothetical protein D6719_06380 [Candidatus Dadabacteria bacterium]|nr:MAG: hypothetical protein D6719_06380 [Candidatus Dadabacteria bacterium]